MKKYEKGFMNPNIEKKDVMLAWNLIQSAGKITLLTHHKPDADGISACAALAHILQKIGKQLETIYPSKPEFPLKRVAQTELVASHTQIPELLIACDTANYDRLYYPEAFHNIPLINIDHHISNSLNGKFNFLDFTASSTCEVVYRLICQWDKTLLDSYVAECLLMGILYDSQVFHTQATSPQTLRTAADLMELGANLFELKSELLSNKSPGVIALWGKILETVQLSANKKAAWVSISQDDLKKYNVGFNSLIGFSNFLWEISGVDVTLVFYETEKRQTKVSLRSKEFDVNQLAKQFGGGGHKNAAGILSPLPLLELVKAITAKL